MSVVFWADNPVDHWVVRCSCGAARSEQQFATYAEAYSFAFESETRPVVCGDDFCAAWPVAPTAVEAIAVDASAQDVQLSGTNAARILDVMGIGEDVHSMDAQDFLGHVATARVASDSGYVSGVLAALEGIAVFAETHDRKVMWG